MDDKHLSDEEKRKKEEEITKRLEEIKNRLNKKKVSNEPESPEKTAAVEKSVKREKADQETKPLAKPSKLEGQKEAKQEVGATKPIEIKMSGKPKEDKSWSKNTIKESENKSKIAAKDNEAKIKPIMQTNKVNTSEKEKKESGFKKIRWLLAGIILLFLFIFTGWYLLNNSGSEQHEFIELDEQANSSGMAVEENNEGENESNSLEAGVQGISDAEVSSNLEDTEVEDKVEIAPIQKTVVKEVRAAVIPAVEKAKLNLPCFVMSYVSTADESKAKKIVGELRGKGLSAGYYFIPDYTAGGPELFKVFVGPYPNRQSAHGDLERIRRYNKDAYYHILE